MIYEVRNKEGESHKVDLLDIKEAAKSGYDPVVVNQSGDEQRVSVDNLEGALSDGYRTILQKDTEEMSTLERYGRGALEALPMAAGIAGSVIGAPLGPGGIVAGAGLGSGLGKSLQTMIETAMGDPVNYEKIYAAPIKEAIMGAAFEGGGQVLGKGIEATKGLVKPMFRQFGRKSKEGHEAITEAAERLGTEPTEGMLTDSHLRQGMESSISQSPYTPGQEIRSQYGDIYGKMKVGAEKTLKPMSEMTQVQAGEIASREIPEVISKRVQPAVDTYEKIAKESPNIDIGETKRVVDNIRNLRYAKYKTGDSQGIVSQISEDLENITTLEQLRDLNSIVKAEMRAALGSKKKTLSDVAEKLNALEKRSIEKSVTSVTGEGANVAKPIVKPEALSASSEEGIVGAAEEVAKAPLTTPLKKKAENLSKDMIKEIKAANVLYKDVSTDVKSLAESLKLGKPKNYQDFVRKIESMSPEDISKKFFDLKNVNSLKTIKKEYPKAFETLKSAKMTEIYEHTLTKGEISYPKLFNTLKRMTPESKEVLFSKKGVKIFDDIETLYNAMPEKMGPSGTPAGQEFRDFSPIDPRNWILELKRRTQSWLLKNPEKASALGRVKMISPEGQAAKRGFMSQLTKEAVVDKDKTKVKPKGQRKWINDGFNKILKHDDKYSGLRSLMIREPKIKKLLINLSGLKEGSKAFNSSISKIDKILKEGER